MSYHKSIWAPTWTKINKPIKISEICCTDCREIKKDMYLRYRNVYGHRNVHTSGAKKCPSRMTESHRPSVNSLALNLDSLSLASTLQRSTTSMSIDEHPDA